MSSLLPVLPLSALARCPLTAPLPGRIRFWYRKEDLVSGYSAESPEKSKRPLSDVLHGEKY
jgi:hypothetical protein